VPLVIVVHRDPSKWMMVPVSPTAYTSFDFIPQTLRRNRVVGLAIDVTDSPVAARMVPLADDVAQVAIRSPDRAEEHGRGLATVDHREPS
jgi:hypothetical protein